MDVIFPEFYKEGMTDREETPLQRNLRFLLEESGMNAYQAAKEAGLGASFVRDILRGKTKSPSADNLAKLAAVFRKSAERLQSVGGRTLVIDGPTTVPTTPIPIVSKVSAGVWLDVTTMDEPDEYGVIEAPHDERWPHVKHYALLVEGDSMDLEYADGTYVTCVDFWDVGVVIRDGLHVHVERRRAGGQLVETTIKAIETIDGVRNLVPKSSNPKWKPFPIEGDESTEVVIRGLVYGGWKRAPR